MAKKTDGIIARAQQKNRETIDKVNDAIDSLKRSKTKAINFETVAKKAGVSRTTLYNNPILKERIQSLRSANKRVSVENIALSKDKLKLQNEKISMLRQYITKLKSDKQKLVLQLVEMNALGQENDNLKKSLLLKNSINGENQLPVQPIIREPIYDDDQIAQIEERQMEQLVDELVECIITLCHAVANLRAEVNELSNKLNPQAPPVYHEVYSDLCKSFEDSPAFSRFEKQLSRLIYE